MSSRASCPRCGADLTEPGLWSDSFTCSLHGEVAPLHPAVLGSDEVLRSLALRSQVPVWVPAALPETWLVTGVRYAGGERSGPLATVVACSGPNALALEPEDQHAADLLLIAEQPGVGLGAHLIGLDELDAGARVGEGSPDLKIAVGGHDTPLWLVERDGAAAYVGEAAGVWLWVVVWPAEAIGVLLPPFEIRDAREPENVRDLAYGALSPRLL